ncbi:MAG TPA: trypsin-like peptidase domain-containing protein, partial [Actinomycetota bacterium]|nr:trypsin-like peptidase domain-containing protein [Actinomycetota bacterium]
VVERVRPAVVNVTSQLASDESLLQEPGEGTGTGFVIDEDGVIVTNYHVVEGALNLRVVTTEGEGFQARVIGGDPNADLAVLKVEADDLPTVPLGDSDELELGETVIALGFALALEGGPSVTSGIISAIGRTITAGDEQGNQRTYEDLLQTDAAINPGNSGGPLVDLNGRVVGINTAGVGAASAENIGFAIAIDRAKEVVSRAIVNPAAAEAYMGISTRTVDAVLESQLELPVDSGALVVDVAPEGPAQAAGIEPGDVIVQVGSRDIDADDDVREALTLRRPGETVEVGVVHRDGREETFSVRLGVRPLPVPSG